MNWQDIQHTLCAARGFTETPDGVRVLADTMMPSGALIYVHMQMRNGTLSMHDNGAAFDELARIGGEIKTQAGVRRMLAETGFELLPTGEIFRHDFTPDQVAIGLALVADASLRAAQYMLDRAKVRTGQPLDARLKAALQRRFPAGRPDFKFEGKARQQKFDFGISTESEVVLLDAVRPDLSSVNSAIVKSLDAMQAEGQRARPILVYDERDHWPSDALNLLKMAGERVSLRGVEDGAIRIAA